MDENASERALPLQWLQYLLTRLVYAALVLVFLIYVTFFGLSMARGVPFIPALRYAGQSTSSYLLHVAQGDLGTAFISVGTSRRAPVTQIIARVLPRSVGLLALALGLGGVLGFLLGSWSAYRRSQKARLTAVLLATAGLSLPSFFLALILQLAALAYTKKTGHPLLPVGGFGWDAHIILPALVLAVRPLAQVARVTTVVISDIQEQDFIRTALAKGLSLRQVRWRHILRNAWVPILTAWLVSLQFSLSSLPVVELYFGWGGIGHALLRAIARKDDLLAVPLIFALGVFFLLVNGLLDLVARILDPRLREAATHLGRSSLDWREAAKDLLDRVRDALLRALKWRPQPSQKRPAPPPPPKEWEDAAASRRAFRRRQWIRGTLGNPAFLLGGLIVIALLIMYFLGPALSPHNPYTTIGLRMVNGKLKSPPFPPSPEFPLGTDMLGRDILSLILAGARQTLTLAFLVVLGRLLVGTSLGLLAGWSAGSRLDQIIQNLAAIIASFPALLLAMILILALGIRQGMRPFIIALTLVGWGHVMQVVRGETRQIRTQPYIESAHVLGLHPLEILWRHVLPNILPTLIVITALEMAGTLLLLGELGFVGVFLGGGAFAEIFVGSDPYHYSDVPEWAALLSNVRQYARTYPWVGIYPALTFGLAILGFNLFGEGLRRLIQDIRLSFARLWSRWTLAGLLVLYVAVSWVQANTGPIAIYRETARAFQGQQALKHVEVLTQETWHGRRIGTPGADAAAQYVAEQFKALGLQPAGQKFTYFLTVKRDFFELTQPPQLDLVDDAGNVVESLEYRKDFAVLPTLRFNAGEGEGPLTVVGFGPLSKVEGRMGIGVFAPALDRIDSEGKVLLLLEEVSPTMWRRRLQTMTLVVTDDPEKLKRGYVYSANSPYAPEYKPMDGAPMFYISKEAADRLLARIGGSVDYFRKRSRTLGPDEIATWDTTLRLRGRIVGKIHKKVPVRHVIGHLPGVSETLSEDLIVVMANYDGVGVDELGQMYPGALDNASGVAAMLELVRSWKEAGYEPKKTFLFVAYAAYGFDYGKPPNPEPDVKQLLGAKFGFSTSYKKEAIVYLRGLGARPTLHASTGGSQHLADLFERAGKQAGVKVKREESPLDISVIYKGGAAVFKGQEAPTVHLTGEEWQRYALTPQDTPDRVQPAYLEKIGRAVSIALQVLGREVNY